MFDVNGCVGEGGFAEQPAQPAQHGAEGDLAFLWRRVAPQDVHEVIAAGWPMPMGGEIDKGKTPLPSRQIAFVHAHASVVLGGYSASEINARRHKRQTFRKRAAKRSQYITGHT